MSRPAVSVLLPVRDAAPWLEEALASLRAQRFEDFEVVLQDDGSRDESLAIAHRAASRDPRVHVEASEPAGIVAALERARERARADLLVRMDADDVAHRERLGTLAQAAADHPDVGFLAHRVRLVPESAVGLGMRRYGAWLDRCLDHETIVAERFVECPLPHPAWAVRREVMEALGGYDEGPFPEDYDLFLRAVDAGVRFRKLPDVLLAWRQHPGRLCLNDERYALERFLDLKVRHLVPWLAAAGRPTVVVGAGRGGKRLARRLVAAGHRPAAFLEVHPRRIGTSIADVPVRSWDARESVADAVLLLAVGTPGSRERLAAELVADGREPGHDFLAVQ